MTKIKAIETRYKGYRFRSRLEARWAVFFDALDVKWEYEKQGFDLGNGIWYLPDFWIPLGVPEADWIDPAGWGFWVEIKPLAPSDDERLKMMRLATGTGHTTFCFWGMPDWMDWHATVYRTDDFYNKTPRDCMPLIVDGISRGMFIGGTKRLGLYCKRTGHMSQTPFQVYTEDGLIDCIALSNAHSVACSARFEHGETPLIA